MDIEQIAGRPNGGRRINSCVRKVETQGSINKLEMRSENGHDGMVCAETEDPLKSKITATWVNGHQLTKPVHRKNLPTP